MCERLPLMRTNAAARERFVDEHQVVPVRKLGLDGAEIYGLVSVRMARPADGSTRDRDPVEQDYRRRKKGLELRQRGGPLLSRGTLERTGEALAPAVDHQAVLGVGHKRSRVSAAVEPIFDRRIGTNERHLPAA